MYGHIGDKLLENKTPLVSVICLTYNHEKYIRKCLDGFVMQRTSFPFEVFVHDDASTDGTPAIIREYAAKYPEIIRPILQERNLFSKGISITGTVILPLMRGTYVANCEGDDYWKDPDKLEKQVRILEANRNCRICLHKVEGISEAGAPIGCTFPKQEIQTGEMTPSVFIDKNRDFFQFSSFLYYKSDLEAYYDNMPEFARISDVGDKPLLLYLATLGDAFFLNEEMSAYRQNSSSGWTTKLIAEGQERIKRHLQTSIAVYEAFDKYTDEKYHETMTTAIREIRFQLAGITFPYRDVLLPEYKSIRKNLSLKGRIKIWLKVVFPRTFPKLLQAIRKLRS